MNYLTAIIAVPLFMLIWIFEVHLRWVSEAMALASPMVKALANTSIVVSTLQMISCWFWLFGFALGKTDNVFSEAKGPGEHGNCVGLVGAEWLLAIFQMLTSIVTFVQMLNVRSTALVAVEGGRPKDVRLASPPLVILITLLATYTGIAFTTAINRRCPQATPVFPEASHYFYPIYLAVDLVSSLFSIYYGRLLRDICLGASILATDAAKTNRSSGKSELSGHKAPLVTAAVGSDFSASGKGSAKNSSKPAKVTVSHSTVELYKFMLFQGTLTVIGSLLAIAIFILQFMVNIPALSLIACVFCVLMYITYAIRRVILMLKFCRKDRNWRPHWRKLFDHNSKAQE
ncbi:hypothetical protein BJ741DRAFT_586259 [Chytriomyces cf. hyalinus JEL632]|nr:hypothetical protein BJ741DRAFT_586259 [Chytriomyces cf. hyalinus JEL632]